MRSASCGTTPTRPACCDVEATTRAGFLILSLKGPFVGYVQTLCVAEGLRSQGLGSELLAFARKTGIVKA